MTRFLNLLTCATALALHLTIWRDLPSDILTKIIEAYDDGGEVHNVDQQRTITYKAHVNALKANIPKAGGLPLELHQSPPDYFLLIDSGANVHVVWDRSLLAYAREHFSNVQWGSVHATSACIAIGHLHCTVFGLNEDCNAWHKIVLDSGSFDTWVVPDSGKQIFSLMRLIRQGHRPHLHGAHPGLHVAGSQLYLPFVSGSSADKSFLYLPCYPPPSRSNLIANSFYPSNMPVLNLQHYSQENDVPDTAWAFPLQATLSESTANLKKKLKDGGYVGKTKSASNIKKRKSPLQIKDEQSRLQRAHEKCCHRADLRSYSYSFCIPELVSTPIPILSIPIPMATSRRIGRE